MLPLTRTRAASITAALLGLALAGPQVLAMNQASSPLSAVYVFGDSLSDNGNLLAATAQAFGAANALPQADNYWQGRFSNGKVAVEVLADKLGKPLVDFAFGGATSGVGPVYPVNANTSFATGLQAQLALHDKLLGGVADPNGLYVVWAGANDLRDVLASLKDPGMTLQQLGAQLASTVQTTYANLAGAVDGLYQDGARHFLLPLLPDLGLTPEGQAAQTLVPTAFFSISGFSAAYNLGLRSTFAGLSLGGASVTVFDTAAAQQDVYANPASYGISDVQSPCFAGYVGEAGAMCAEGFDTTRMFWDKVHPSAITHAVLGAQMAAAVPEPQTLLMMAVGMAALLGLRQRRAG